MSQNLEELSNKLSTILLLCENAVEQIHKQQYWKLSYTLKSVSTLFPGYLTSCDRLFEQSVISSLLSNMTDIVTCQTNLNYVLLADTIELQLLPTLYDMQAAIIANIDITKADYFEENLALINSDNCKGALKLSMELSAWKNEYDANTTIFEENYKIEPTNLGAYPTVNKRFGDTFYYFHSNKNPIAEAKEFAAAYAEPDIFHYVIIGFGLGYEAYAFLEMDKRFTLTVLEPDIQMLGAAFEFTRLKGFFASGRFHLEYSPDFFDLGDYIHQNNTKLIVHYPTLHTLKEGRIKELLKGYFLQLSTIQEQRELLDTNFYYNHMERTKSIDTIKDSFFNKTVIYLGGGPSTETKLDMIKSYIESHPDTVSICAGKVYRKLLEQGFTPDYVIFTDASSRIVWHLQGIPKTTTKLLYLATASHDTMMTFQGEKYIVYQQGFSDSEKIAHQNGYTLFETGGSVSTTAIDIPLRLGCKKLITTGLDYSYPEKKSHAFGICGNVPDSAAYIHKKNINGDDVITSEVFLSYLKWTEQRIAKDKQAETINLTDGIPIYGMENRVEL